MTVQPAESTMSVPQQKSIQQIKQNLATAFQLLAKFGMDDLTYTHLSARVPGEDSFFIHPFGLLFEEVTADNLLKVSFDGVVLEGQEYQYNKTGFTIHGAVYQARPDLQAIFHLHTVAGVAVSAQKCGLLPLSQFALHFYNRHSYHTYNSLALNPDHHGAQLVKDLGSHNTMILQNHGTLTCGTTIQEAFFYTYYLEKACQVQCKVLASQQDYILPKPEICEQAAQDMRNFEPDLGNRDWQALLRMLGKQQQIP